MVGEDDRIRTGREMVEKGIDELKEQYKLNVEQNMELVNLRNRDLSHLVNKFLAPWVTPAAYSKPKKGEYHPDPIHGTIFLEKELVPLFKQPIVQRLHEISQLSFSYLFYPMSKHSRLAHSMGVSRIMDDILTTTFKKN